MGFGKQTLCIYKNGKNEGSFLDLVRIFDDYESLSYTKGFTSPGDFQITLNQATFGSEEFKIKRIIRIGEDNSKSVIIQSIKKTMDDHGNVIMTVSGQELWSVLGKRPVIPPTGQAYYDTATSTPVETGIKTMISQNCGTLAIASRKFAALSILTDQARGPGYKFSERYSNLLESVSEALLSTSSGIQCILNHTSKKFELEWSAGTDRTATVILSSDFDTAQNATMTETDLSYRNLILIAGQGEGVDRNVRTVYSGSEPTDLDRNEIFQDARDLSVNASLDARAAQKLEEYGYTKQISVNPLIYSNIRYERDYFVGDFVTFREFGITQSVWITAATESWVNGTYTLSLSVDKQPATVSSQIQALNSLFSQTAATVDPVLPSSSFLLLAGRSGGQSAYGGTAASDKLTLNGTSHATKGNIDLNPGGGLVSIGTSTNTDGLLKLYSTTGSLPLLYLLNLQGAGQAHGIRMFAGSNASDYTFDVRDQNGARYCFYQDGLGNTGFGIQTINLSSSNANARYLAIAGDGSANAGAQGELALINNRATATVGDSVGAVEFISFNNGSTPSYLTRKVAEIISTLEGSSGADGFGSKIEFKVKSDNSTSTTIPLTLFTSGAMIPNLYGSRSASGDLTLSSTSHATKGKIKFGNSVYDELNNRLGIGPFSESNPISTAHFNGILTIGAGFTPWSVGTMQFLPDQASPFSGRLTYGTDGTGWKFSISKNLSGVITDQLVIVDNGNVGVNDQNPIEKLTVAGNISPSAHNTYDIGTTAVRWKDLWLQSGAFNGSDARLKTEVRHFTKNEINAAKQLSKEIGFYKWIESVEKKGESARSHCGLTVQKAIEIMEKNELNPFDYGFIGYDQWDDKIVHHDEIKAVEAKEAVYDIEGNMIEKAIDPIEYKPEWDEIVIKAGDAYSFRYDQLNIFIAKGIEERLAVLENMSNIV